MGTHNIIGQQIREEVWLVHKTMHTTPATFPNELCIFCQEEAQAIADDHIQGEADEQLRAEQEIDNND